jgi:hypothetical protein
MRDKRLSAKGYHHRARSPQLVAAAGIQIVAALVNPVVPERDQETIALLNPNPEAMLRCPARHIQSCAAQTRGS